MQTSSCLIKKIDDIEESSNWNRRNRENLEKMKSGDVFEIATVIKVSLNAKCRKAYPPARKNAWHFPSDLVSEIALASNKDDEEIKKLIIQTP